MPATVPVHQNALRIGVASSASTQSVCKCSVSCTRIVSLRISSSAVLVLPHARFARTHATRDNSTQEVRGSMLREIASTQLIVLPSA